MATVSIDVIAKDSFSGILGNFGNIISGIESALNLAGRAFSAFTGFAMEGLEAIASYERLEMSLQSLVASQLLQSGAAEDMTEAMAAAAIKAEELVAWNEELAIKSPFTSEGVAQAFRMAMAYGFSADESKRLTEAMIDFAAGSGATEYAMQQIARALGQISATGKLTGGDMLQLVNAGLPVAEILADAFNVTTAEIMEMREKGLIPAKDAVEAITVYLETNFQGAAEAQANTWAGLQGTFADLKAMGLREFFGGLFETLQPLAVEIAEWLQGPGLERLSEWGAQLGEMTQGVVSLATSLPSVIERFREFFSSNFGDGLANFREFFSQFSQDIAPVVEEHFPRIASLFADLGRDVLPDVVAMFNYISEWFVANQDLIVGTVERLLIMFEQLLVILRAAWNILAPLLTGIIALGTTIGTALMSIFTQFDNVGSRIVDGLIEGLRTGALVLAANIAVFVANLVNNFKALLGIASPSTVFFSIGKDVVQGLINGIASMFPTLTSVVNTLFNLITGGSGGTGGATGDATGLLGGSTGTTGGRDMGILTTGGVLSGGTVTNNYSFYGTVYMSGVGPEGTYDCAPSISTSGMAPAVMR